MTKLQLVRLIATREIRDRVRSKPFLMSTAFTLLLILAVSILPGVLSNDEPPRFDVGLSGVGADQLAERLPLLSAAIDPNVKLDIRRVEDAAEADRLVTKGDLDVAVVDGQIIVEKELSPRLGLLLQESNRQLKTESALAAAGVGNEVAGRVLRPEPLPVQPLDAPTEAEDSRRGLVTIGSVLLYIQLLTYGYWVAGGVVEEKSSRVVELLLSKARPSQLLAGKVIGIGLLGFVQLIAFVVIGLVTASLANTVELPPGTTRAAVEVVAWFVLGFALYSCLSAVAGALASRAEELQSTMTPLTVVTMASFFAASTSAGDPSSVIAKVATFVPFSAPMVLPIRTTAGAIGLPAIALSVAIVLASIVAAMALAARAYSGGALHVRGQLSLRKALVASRDEAVTASSIPATSAARRAAGNRILDAAPMEVPDPADLRTELDELHGRRG